MNHFAYPTSAQSVFGCELTPGRACLGASISPLTTSSTALSNHKACQPFPRCPSPVVPASLFSTPQPEQDSESKSTVLGIKPKLLDKTTASQPHLPLSSLHPAPTILASAMPAVPRALTFSPFFWYVLPSFCLLTHPSTSSQPRGPLLASQPSSSLHVLQ